MTHMAKTIDKDVKSNQILLNLRMGGKGCIWIMGLNE
jgi:hypothetical protein